MKDSIEESCEVLQRRQPTSGNAFPRFPARWLVRSAFKLVTHVIYIQIYIDDAYPLSKDIVSTIVYIFDC